jgi:ubiquitin carboxyl-terminal hydrolase 9/24
MLHLKAVRVWDASGLCEQILDFSGKPISTSDQRDVDEFLHMFLDRLGENLKKAGDSVTVTEAFGGQFANEIVSLGCPHRSENVESFVSLNLQLDNKSRLVESLRAFTLSERLEGENSYYCDRCDKKMSAKKRTTFKVLPNTLVVALKRFRYDSATQYTTSLKS